MMFQQSTRLVAAATVVLLHMKQGGDWEWDMVWGVWKWVNGFAFHPAVWTLMSFSCSFVCHTDTHAHTQTLIQIEPLAVCQSTNKTNCSTVAVGTPGGLSWDCTPFSHKQIHMRVSISLSLPLYLSFYPTTSARWRWLLFWLLATPTQQAETRPSWVMLILDYLHLP